MKVDKRNSGFLLVKADKRNPSFLLVKVDKKEPQFHSICVDFRGALKRIFDKLQLHLHKERRRISSSCLSLSIKLLLLLFPHHHHHHHHSRDCEERWSSIGGVLSCGRRAVLSDVSKSGSPIYGTDHKRISRREAGAARSEAVDAAYEEDAPFSSSRYKLHHVQE